MTGEVGILNVGAGDTKLSFDPAKPDDAKRSAQIVRDMIRRGFVLLIEIGRNDKGPIYQRAHDFDPETHEYIIAGDVADDDMAKEMTNDRRKHTGRKTTRKSSTAPARQAGRKATRRVPAAATNAVAVSRTAGG